MATGSDPQNGNQWQEYLDQSEELVAHCDFSPGPWWGFNGVRTLLLTDRRLIAVPRPDWRRQPPSYDLTGIEEVSWRRRRAVVGSGHVVALRLHLDSRAKRFTSKYEYAEDFASRLRDAVSLAP